MSAAGGSGARGLWVHASCGRCRILRRIPGGQRIVLGGRDVVLCDRCWDSFESWIRRRGPPAPWVARGSGG